ncbi:MAG: GNAT family N-acetyltransferase [Actinomycetota bacterium]|nr:GNAT family N-acetyltransferase [Actinomycetota bacterium]
MTPPQVRLRPATAADEPLLFQIYAASRAAELAQVDWSDEQRLAFLQHQHTAQATAYRSRHPDGEFLVIELADGRGIGRLYRARLDDGELRVLDIALLPEWCGRGIGGALLADVLAEGEREGALVSLHVEAWNPALRLYTRLGFVEAGRNDVYLRMERRPG